MMLIFISVVFTTVVIILIAYIKSIHSELSAKSGLLSELSEYRTKAENLYHLSQMQEEEIVCLRTLINMHKIDY